MSMVSRKMMILNKKFKRKLTLLGSDKFEEVKRLMHLKELALKEK